MTARPLDFLALFALGVGWGLTMPLAKVAVSTGHQPYGLIFWQLVIVVAVLAPLAWLTGRRVALRPRHLVLFVVIALTGAVLPDVFFYLAASKLPAGVLSIALAAAPLFSMPIALALGTDAFTWPRLAGLTMGMAGIVLMIGPKTSLPDPEMSGFVLVALLAPALYATEGNVVAKWGTGGLDPFSTIVGASVVGAVITLPLALLSGQWINPLAAFGRAEAALVAGAATHGLVYAAYVWLVGRAGSVFAAQSAYLTTAFGVIWSMTLLGERYSPFVWASLVLLLIGIFFVQPRPRIGLAPAAGMGKYEPRRERDGPG
ncbi:EamA family transporter [Roseovarius salis]|uniref:DMT family transporter n=1 Tax=Roseovarius salis TaxID=3376063 RepID=UPI0037C6C4B0